MEKQREFKPIKGQTTNKSSTMGNASPLDKSLVVNGLTDDTASGKIINKRQTAKNPKGSGRKPKTRDKSFYPGFKFNEIYPKVFLVLKPDSKLDISNYTDFIHSTTTSEIVTDIVDILPPLYEKHYQLIADSTTRFMEDDTVIVNFKFRSTNLVKNEEEKIPTKIKEIKFVSLVDMTVITAELENGNKYLIHELDHYATN